MKLHRAMGLILAVAGVVLGLATVLRGQSQSGDWTIRRSDEPGKVEFSVMDSRGGRHFHSSSEWEVKEFTGLDLSKAGRQEVHFAITRDAGRFECEGFVKDGEGAGLFHFVPDEKYAQEMKSLGFGGIDADKQWAMAIHDVSLKFVREIKARNLQGLDTDKLIAFRIHGVSPAFISDLHSAGLTVTDSDKLIAFRIHGVSPEMVRSVRQAGYDPDPDKLIAMRIHGASPEWMGELKKCGYDHVDLDKLIAFRIHGVSPDFIGQLQKLGYSHPEHRPSAVSRHEESDRGSARQPEDSRN
jgi:hypothetical protein